MSKQISRLLSEYFALKDTSKQLKSYRQEIAKRVGKCQAGPDWGPCYMEDRLEKGDYCEACIAKDEVSMSIKRNAIRRVAIVNSLRALVKKN